MGYALIADLNTMHGVIVIFFAAMAVLLLPMQLTSKDRMITGSVKLPDSWTGISLHFINTTTQQDLGTFANIVENMSAATPAFKIYNHRSDIYADAEDQNGPTDATVTQQKVVFYKDDNDPKLLHFATTFDGLGTARVEIIKNGSVMGYNAVTLTSDTDFSTLINAVDDRVANAYPAPTVDPTDPNGPGGGGIGSGLLVAQEPGSMSFPGAIDPNKSDPTQLVLPVHSGTTVPSGADHDLSLITLRQPTGLTSNVGTVTLTVSAPSSVTLFNQTATHVLANYSVNLAAPAGDLAALATGNAQVWIRGAAANSDVTLTYTYTDANGTVQQTDTVQLSVTPTGAILWPGTTMRNVPLFCGVGGIRGPPGAALSLMSMKVWSSVTQTVPPSSSAQKLNDTGLTTKSLLDVFDAVVEHAWKIPTGWVTGFVEGFAGGVYGDVTILSSAASLSLYLQSPTNWLPFAQQTYMRGKMVYAILQVLAKTSDQDRSNILNGFLASTYTNAISGSIHALPWTYKNTDADAQAAAAYCGGYAAGVGLEQILLLKGAGLTLDVIKGTLNTAKAGTAVALPAIDIAYLFKLRMVGYLSQYCAMADMQAVRQMLEELVKQTVTTEVGSVTVAEELSTELGTLSVSSGTDVFDTVTTKIAQYVKIGQWGTVGKGALERLADLLLQEGSNASVDEAVGFSSFYGSIVNPSGKDFYKFLISFFGDSGTVNLSQLKSFLELFSDGSKNYFTRNLTNNTWTSTGGLIYGTDASFGSRILHVLNHCIPGTAEDGVFTIPRDQLFQLMDQAFKDSGRVGYAQASTGNYVWVCSAGQNVGTAAPNLGGAVVDHIAFVIKPNTQEIITAFPVPAGWVPPP